MTTMRSGTAGIADGAVALAGRLWAANERKLSAATLVKLGVDFAIAYFPELKRQATAITFPYPPGWKARAFPEKAHVCGGGFVTGFWNLAAVLAGPMERVYITEGELDACALVEAGIAADSVLSVPTGARMSGNSGHATDLSHEMKGYGYVDDALRAGLSRAKCFVWCGDSDDVGHSLRSDMVRLLGAARFHWVEWPDGCKDANDFLRSDGHTALADLVRNGALPWPVEGLYRLDSLPEPAPLTTWNPGFVSWGRRLLLAPRTLSVVTGHPGHGKTLLWAQLWYQVARAYNLAICVASFETRPKPHLRRQLRSLFHQKLELEMSAEEIAVADKWINDHYLFLVHPEQRPTLGWFLDMAEVAVVREGARVVQLDPWNRLEASRGERETETDYIGRCLRTLYVFAQDFNIHLQIIAHPAKMHNSRRGEAPMLEDISGSKHWDNMPDQGFVVHRPQLFNGGARRTECELIHRKARFEELGYPCQLRLNYALDTRRYLSIDDEEQND